MSEAHTLRILLVEDDAEDATIFQRYAAQISDYAVSLVHVAEADEAKRRLAGEPFDLVFLDLHLRGGADGMGFLRGLRRAGADVPVIIVTGAGDEVKAVEAMKSGAYDYLVKDLLSTDLIELAIRNAQEKREQEQDRTRTLQRLEELSVTDELTSLANRRRLTERLEEEAERSARTGHPFAVLMIDLDHFKEVNDRYGHQTGDDVLKKCAGALREHVRRTDFAARFGGEEFCVVLPETGRAGARRVAEKLRRAVKSIPDPVPTISIGLALWEPGSSARDLLHHADQGLYRAKEAGRDRVEVYGKHAGGDQ